ncbi:hypothetical protein Cgig2_016216 [Carnegiea gigantea]|uniref:SWIM-type domain-containing protein n=1 Tax=Carnegiea gigantea TaxID=171969 RepID=A0A9Q1GYD1_9CARY|nr:hypothetical protein Cgig2_016216 [Carnegiea gigantea]
MVSVFRGIVLPKYAGFKWHPPGMENQRWPLNTDNDWVMLVHQWELIRGSVIPIYVVELYVPSQLLDGLQKAKEKETAQFTSPCEPTLDPSLTEARIWANNLIVTPSSVYIDPNATIRRPIPKAAKDKPNASSSPSPSSLQPSSKQANTVLEPVNSPRRPLTRSQSSPSTKSAVPTTPSSSQPSEGLSHVVLSPTKPLTRSQTSPIPIEKRQAQPSSVATGRRTKRQPQIPQLDAFDSEVDENVEEQVEEYLESDSEDSDFNESDEVSLDNESDDNEVLDEFDLELDTEKQMRLGHVDADGSQGHVVISKMAKVFKQGRLWSRNRDGRHHQSFEEHYALSIKKDLYSQFLQKLCCPLPWTFERSWRMLVLTMSFSLAHCNFKAMDKIKQKEPTAYQWLRDNETLEYWDRNCLSVLHAGQGEFDVVEGCTNFIVKLKEHFCDCKKWQITSLPCKHSTRRILRMKGQLEDYCAPWFSTDNYRKLYKNIIHPISDPCMWGDTNLPTLDPPVERRKRGRPEKHNRREHFSGTKRCKQCKQLGHTSLTCGRPRDESGRLLEKYKKKRKTSTRPVEGQGRHSAPLAHQLGHPILHQ